jgi:hypothetical protein
MPLSAKDQEAVMSLCSAFLREVGEEPRLSFDKFFGIREETIKKITALPGIAEELEGQDIESVFEGAPTYFDKPYNKIADSEFVEYISARLFKKHTFSVFFPLTNVFGFPDGYRLGPAKLVLLGSLPGKVQEFLERGEVGGANSGYPASSGIGDGQGRTNFYLQVDVDAYGSGKAVRKASRTAQESLHIIRFEYEQNFLLSQFGITLDEGGEIQVRSLASEAWTSHVAELDTVTQELDDILSKPDANELERRLRSGIRLFGLAMEAFQPEIKFSLFTNALEGLLMTKGDRDYLRMRLAEKVSFLLETESSRRKEMFEMVRDLYDRRSDFVHQNAKYKPIEEEEVLALKRIFVAVFNRLLELRAQGYVSVEKCPAKYVDAMIDDLKFG